MNGLRFYDSRSLAGFLLPLLVAGCTSETPLFQSEEFTVTRSAVRQGNLRAEVTEDGGLRSNYLFRDALVPRRIQFKFALNGRDNEAPPGQDHVLYLVPEPNGELVTQILVFGQAEDPGPPPMLERPLAGPVQVTFRLDMRSVLEAFRTEGTFQPTWGTSVSAADFGGVYIAGSESPLSWDFNAFSEDRKLHDQDGDGIYEVSLVFEGGGTRPFDDEGFAVWHPSVDVSNLPRHVSNEPLLDALHALSLEELKQDIRPDGAFMAGAKWEGVWTRDISYSILLSLALLEPEASQTSLLAKVSPDGRIIQDTGTGGSWPISSDRMTWALAAWEVYLVTGDRTWLGRAFDIISRSLEADLLTTWDPEAGLFRGESSFLDWREQSYPRWMDPRDIYLSQTLGTNAVFFRTLTILAEMAELLGVEDGGYRSWAQQVSAGMNAHLWNEDLAGFGQFRHGRLYPLLSERTEALGTVLTSLFGATTSERSREALANLPVTAFGVPTLWPQIPGIPPYHNDSIWPFVVAYTAWAAADAGNGPLVEHSLASLYRASALFLTNKENMVADSGDDKGTQINSDRQLWSVAGNLATVYRVLLGIRLHPDGMEFKPFVPESYSGLRRVENLQYRDSELTVIVEGFGPEVASAQLDGRPIERAFIPADLQGQHEIHLRLGGSFSESPLNLQANLYGPREPTPEWTDGRLAWNPVEGSASYRIFRNGSLVATAADTSWAAPSQVDGLAEYQVVAATRDGLRSFASRPVRAAPTPLVAGPGVDRAVWLTSSENPRWTQQVRIPETGRYVVEVRYANGSGPVNTDNKAGIRSLYLADDRVGPVVMPQRGLDAWDDWGISSPVVVQLEAGAQILGLRLDSLDQNMDGVANSVRVAELLVTRVD